MLEPTQILARAGALGVAAAIPGPGTTALVARAAGSGPGAALAMARAAGTMIAREV